MALVLILIHWDTLKGRFTWKRKIANEIKVEIGDLPTAPDAEKALQILVNHMGSQKAIIDKGLREIDIIGPVRRLLVSIRNSIEKMEEYGKNYRTKSVSPQTKPSATPPTKTP